MRARTHVFTDRLPAELAELAERYADQAARAGLTADELVDDLRRFVPGDIPLHASWDAGCLHLAVGV